MPNRNANPIDAVLAISIAAFLLAQPALLAWDNALPAAIALQVWLATAVIAAASAKAWRARAFLPAHADMLLLMLAWGGFGMLWGWQIDGGIDVMRHAHMNHAHMAQPLYSGFTRWFNAMNGLMLLFAIPPSIPYARCLQPYRPHLWRLVAVLVLDSAGMILGMMAGGKLLGHPLGSSLAGPALGHHLGMLLGMLGGMVLTMLARPWLVPLPKHRKTV